MSPFQNPDPKARFVWAPHLHRTQVVFFRREFKLSTGPVVSFPLHVFADTRYRLFVNGRFLGSGPARFVTQHPEFDTFELRDDLVSGDNAIVVEAYFYGCSSFQTMPDGRGGMIAWGGSGGVDLATPGEWRMLHSEAWDPNTALLSFAQNACEVCDTRKLDPQWLEAPPVVNANWETPVEINPQDQPWGPLRPRSIPPQRLAQHRPERLVVSGPLADGEEIAGFRFPVRWLGRAQDLPINLRQVFQTWIWSPKAQEIHLALFWGEYWFNTEKLSPAFNGTRSKRSQVRIDLQEGFNCLCGHLQFLTPAEFYDGVFGLPRTAGLKLVSAPAHHAGGRFRLSPLVREVEVPEWIKDGQPVDRAGWLTCGGIPERLTPARVMAWRRVAEKADRDLSLPREGESFADPAGHLWVFRFPEEYVGHIVVEVEGSPGSLVDVAYDEWLREDGLVDLYRTNPFVNTVERFILRGGRQTLRTLNVRGGRFLQVAMVPGHGKVRLGQPSRLLDVRVEDVRSLERGQSGLWVGDAQLEAIWEGCVRTLIGSAEDGYSDSPWRERGTYIGDLYVNQLVHHLLSADLSLARRSLRLFAEAQLPSGQLPAVAPAHHRVPHEDYTLIWLLALYDHWALTGNQGLVKEMWGAVERIWSSPVWQSNEEGLWSGDDLNQFVDWGVIPDERLGQANAILNALRIAALERCATLAEIIGHTARADAFRQEAQHVRSAFARVLWLEDEGRYAASLAEGEKGRSIGLHGNLLAWAFRIGTDEQLERLRRYLFRRLEKNLVHGLAAGQFSGYAELYFWSFLLPALAERGYQAEAVGWIRQHWGFALDADLGTMPECFCQKDQGNGTKCHSWSGFPAVFLHRYLLGLRQLRPGDPNTWILDPLPVPGFDRAEGVQAHASGWIRVAWERKPDGQLMTKIEVPASVCVECPRAA